MRTPDKQPFRGHSPSRAQAPRSGPPTMFMAELTCFLHVLCLGVLELLHLMMPLCWGVVPWALVCPRASRGAASNPSLLELSCRESDCTLPMSSQRCQSWPVFLEASVSCQVHWGQSRLIPQKQGFPGYFSVCNPREKARARHLPMAASGGT